MKCTGQTRGYPVLGLDGKPLLCPEWAKVLRAEAEAKAREGRRAAQLLMSMAVMLPTR